MKKLLLIAVVLFCSVAVKAQTEKGTVMLGGGIQFQAAEGTSIFVADPNVGYFFANNFAGGAQIELVSGGGNTVWGIGPFVRGYIGKNPKGKPFGQAGISFAGASGGEGTSTAFQAKLGYAAFLSKNVALEFAGNLLTGEGATIFGIGIGFQIHLK